MIELTGNNLCERRKELNLKINDAVKNNMDFNQIKLGIEKSDVDKLYKIGVASKYKNLEYIIEIFKSGDSLYISHALKCTWIYSDEYSHIINPEYLHENVFPLMSSKMIKKLLTTILLYVRDTRAVNFYSYCVKWKYTNIAKKFLIFTPDVFKLGLLKDEKLLNDLKGSHEYLTQYLGDSFKLAEAYYNTASSDKQAHTLYQIRHFYFKSNLKYLDMLRKCNSPLNKNLNRLGLRISKDIMKKHKDEIYKNPLIYLYMLNKRMLVQYSTEADAKFFAKSLFVYECPKPYNFWYGYFCKEYKDILDKIPIIERFQFIKEIFTVQYPMEKFETSKNFYDLQLYMLMTPEEREKWALAQLENGSELRENGKDFLLYQFISFDKTFIAMKKYILVTVDFEKRIEMNTTLVKSAKTDSELETLFDYYYKRHVNEKKSLKQRFIDAVINEHNVYKFSESCWEKFNKILYSLEIYNVQNDPYCESEYKHVALVYHIIHKKELPEALIKYVDYGVYFREIQGENEKLSNADVDVLHQYLLKFYLDKLTSFNIETYNNEIKYNFRKYIRYVLDYLHHYNKTKEDIPDIVNKYIELDYSELQHHDLIRVKQKLCIQQADLIRYIKKDKNLIVSQLSLIKDRVKLDLELNTLLKILRTYFSCDLATMFLKMYQEILIDPHVYLSAIKKAVYGIFQLSDINDIKEFMAKYVPTNTKIDHANIDERLFGIQKSICQLACNSRYPIPLIDLTKYIKGDYVPFCLPMFNFYLAKIPKPLCLEFVKSLLDTQLSVQKHALRLAFKCFNVDDLRKVILGVWKKTKNVSLRLIIYTCLHNKIKDVDELIQNELFEDLKLLTRSLHEEDNEEIFNLITSDQLPNRFIGEYVETAWNVVDLPEKKVFTKHAINVINCMERNIYLMRKEVIESIIEDHINYMLKQDHIKYNYKCYEQNVLVESKWNLFHKYVTFFTDDDNCTKKNETVKVVITESTKLWNKVDNKKYIIKEFVSTLIKAMNEKSFTHGVSNYSKTNKLFEQVLESLQDSLRSEEIYEISWYIRVSNLTRNVLFDVEQEFSKDDLLTKTDKAMSTFVKEFNNVFIEYVEKGQCYVALYNKIEHILKNNVSRMLLHLKFTGDLDVKNKSALILLCSKMVEYKTFESYMFASKLMPCEIHEYYQREYANVLNKLHSYDNKEIQCYLYMKFVTDNNYKFSDCTLS